MKIKKFDQLNEEYSLQKEIEISKFDCHFSLEIKIPDELCYDKYGKSDQLVWNNMMKDQQEKLTEYLQKYTLIFDKYFEEYYQNSSEYYDTYKPYCFVVYSFIPDMNEIKNISLMFNELSLD